MFNSFRIKIENSENSSYISFEDFKKIILKDFPKRTLRWVEIAYRKFNDSVYSDKVPLQTSILPLISLIANEG